MLLINKGEILTCENGHELYEVVQDICIAPNYRMPGPEVIAPVHPDLPQPALNDEYARCPDCGGRWIDLSSRQSRISVAGEWRP